MRFAEMARRVRADLGQQHRYAHCVRVARMSENLAQVHGLPRNSARVAGMLHDLARLYPAQRLLQESEQRALPIDRYAREHPIVLHAPLSAALARERYNVADPAVLSAISKHTLGAGTMTPLDCILYLADSLEPGRDFPERAGLAELASRDLRAAMHATIASSVRYLRERQVPIAPQTAEAMKTFGHMADVTEVCTGGHS
ncbi:MAG TPA: bis(5'-nucleosyl)-tetraphosphatase (symmetrical) YqeK [Candidatus Baltobacteraceae bacterium]|jgi:predicted HD superfamily hydrolase involved in NAD metabolism|nr:bis(5'-nucleosyl)-tetraphosphatase (symmetrical) YqeK [Candidatus Baltobacteraceae bacterium]